MQQSNNIKLPTVSQIAFKKLDGQYVVPDSIVDLAYRMKPSSEKSEILKKLLVIHRLTERIQSFCNAGDSESHISVEHTHVEENVHQAQEPIIQPITVEKIDRTYDETLMKDRQPLDMSANHSNLTTCMQQGHNEVSEYDQKKQVVISPNQSRRGSTATSTLSNYRLTIQSCTPK